ncbi:uncharacterized protein MICPUCDRAFT_60880 [Micromonas pusilla CCMP1545]|uniref:Predicted protein n=1 Tax=Micromonas pusilla (strain CCMP1545) TaxID=564608 RepID=C1MZW9_MICPC|nr:uncharacterized protein MICPUCDRAFT_60880 [Micromonas pusilla CCMP1545]EEH54677.1 predicted protein [Micromonas pusilla CCMP1545]|eukprot:XP_003061027.1 predicted protein [Micromonas pusilla CCMP1545]
MASVSAILHTTAAARVAPKCARATRGGARASAARASAPGRKSSSEKSLLLSARAATAPAGLFRASAAPSTRRGARVVTSAAADDEEKVPFGYTRQDVILIGVGVTALGFALYYGLQAKGVSAIWAGNIVQLTFVGGLTVAWVGSYVGRVMNKDMTYVKQLKDYEDAVMAKRLEELPEAELEKMMEEISKLDPK